MSAESPLKPPTLPPDLLAIILARFDHIHSLGVIKYGPSVPQVVPLLPDHGVTHSIQFRVASALASKPSLSSALARTPANPFLEPDPNVIVTHVGDHHLLLINKFCVCRPQLLVTTRVFASQSDPLDAKDLAACWVALVALNASPASNEDDGPDHGEPKANGKATQLNEAEFMAIYNCGDAAGNSQPHKHLQIIPRPRPEEYVLFPDAELKTATSESRNSLDLNGTPKIWSAANVPFLTYITSLPKYADVALINQVHAMLLERTFAALKSAGMAVPYSYNMVLTEDWMMLIPRRHQGRNGINANAAGMAGMVWLTSSEQLDKWQTLGLKQHLEFMGMPLSERP